MIKFSLHGKFIQTMKIKEYLLDSQKILQFQFSLLKLYLPEDHDPLQRQTSLQHEPEEDNTQLEIRSKNKHQLNTNEIPKVTEGMLKRANHNYLKFSFLLLLWQPLHQIVL